MRPTPFNSELISRAGTLVLRMLRVNVRTRVGMCVLLSRVSLNYLLDIGQVRLNNRLIVLIVLYESSRRKKYFISVSRSIYKTAFDLISVTVLDEILI